MSWQLVLDRLGCSVKVSFELYLGPAMPRQDSNLDPISASLGKSRVYSVIPCIFPSLFDIIISEMLPFSINMCTIPSFITIDFSLIVL